MNIDFSEGSGYVSPSALRTGDLIFPKTMDAIVLMSKPAAVMSVLSSGFLRQVLKALQLHRLLRRAHSLYRTLLNPDHLHDETWVVGYYSGHVAMIVQENGNTYVIEANASDYSNYRVALHPYYLANDAADPQLMRGWLNRRHAKDQKMWVQRPKAALSTAQQSALTFYAKSLLGRPYGLLDTLRFADDSRLYCSDFIYKCYHHIGYALDDQRTWSWVISSPTLNALGAELPLQALLLKWADRIAARFKLRPPALSLPMLFHSQCLQSLNTVTDRMTEKPQIYGVE